MNPALHWSSSGDVFTACQFIGNGWTSGSEATGYLREGYGAYLKKAFQTNFSNCVFEYNGRAFYINDCPDFYTYNCWNEENYNNSTVIGSARFVGGYNFDNNTVDHQNATANHIVSFEHSTSLEIYNNNKLRYRQIGGIVTEGVAVGRAENVIPNPLFSTEGVPSMDTWHNGGFGSSIWVDENMPYGVGYSCRINMSAQRDSKLYTDNISVTSGVTYTASINCYYDDIHGPRDGIVIFLEYQSPFGVSAQYSIMPTATNEWQNFIYEFTIPNNVSTIKFFINAPDGGMFWVANPVLTSVPHQLREQIKVYPYTTGGANCLQVKNGLGESFGFVPLSDVPLF